MSELAEALRSLDDTRKQKNDVSRELKELKYAGVGAWWAERVPLSSQGKAAPCAGPVCLSLLCLTLSICRMGLNGASMLALTQCLPTFSAKFPNWWGAGEGACAAAQEAPSLQDQQRGPSG